MTQPSGIVAAAFQEIAQVQTSVTETAVRQHVAQAAGLLRAALDEAVRFAARRIRVAPADTHRYPIYLDRQYDQNGIEVPFVRRTGSGRNGRGDGTLAGFPRKAAAEIEVFQPYFNQMITKGVAERHPLAELDRLAAFSLSGLPVRPGPGGPIIFLHNVPEPLVPTLATIGETVELALGRLGL